jgi:hypothetical protein
VLMSLGESKGALGDGFRLASNVLFSIDESSHSILRYDQSVEGKETPNLPWVSSGKREGKPWARQTRRSFRHFFQTNKERYHFHEFFQDRSLEIVYVSGLWEAVSSGIGKDCGP